MPLHEHFMRLALEKARAAIHRDQPPIAACIVRGDEVLGCCHNTVYADMDVTAHAEMQVIRQVCKRLNTIDLKGCVLYSTCEPCTMCLSASHWAGISKIVFAAPMEEAARLGIGGLQISCHKMLEIGTGHIALVGGCLRDDAVRLLEQWRGVDGVFSGSQYDMIAGQYAKTKWMSIPQHINAYSLFQHIGAVQGLTILELGSGEGRYTRSLKRQGARRVVGVEVSQEMIELARRSETNEPLGIDYLQMDILDAGIIGTFDLVVAANVLHHAASREQLNGMCKFAFDNLKPGGRFIALFFHPDLTPERFSSLQEYGVELKVIGPWQEGAMIQESIGWGEDKFDFTLYHWSRKTYEQGYFDAGFKHWDWHDLGVSPQGLQKFGTRYWQNYLENPISILISAQKILPTISSTPSVHEDSPHQQAPTMPRFKDQGSYHSLTDWLGAICRQYPRQTALSTSNTTLSYEQLQARVAIIAHELHKHCFDAESIVGVLMPPGIESVIAMLAIMQAGGAYLPLDPDYPELRLANLADEAGIKVVLSLASRPIPAWASGREILLLDQLLDAGMGRASASQTLDIKRKPGHLAYVIYTSGTTGKPKGVMVEHRQVIAMFESAQSVFQFQPGERWTWYHSASFGYSLWEIFGALLTGGQLVIVPDQIRRSPEEFHQFIVREHISILSLTPSGFRLFDQIDSRIGSGSSGLRRIFFSGEPLPQELVIPWLQRHGDMTPELINLYAATETSGAVAWNHIRLRSINHDTRALIGRPLPGIQLRCLADQPASSTAGEAAVGELLISGAPLARGYLNLTEATASKFVIDPFNDQPGSRWYRTGDRARQLESGDWEYHGRIDNQVKIMGRRVELEEIETHLLNLTDVQAAAVTVVNHTQPDRQLAAVIVVKTGGQATPASLRQQLGQRVPDYMIPTIIEIVDQLPVNDNGKINRSRLPLMVKFSRPTDDQRLTPVPDNLSAQLTAWIKEILGVNSLQSEENFLEHGATSIDLIRIANLLDKEIGFRPSMEQLFHNPSVQGIIAAFTLSPVATAKVPAGDRDRGEL